MIKIKLRGQPAFVFPERAYVAGRRVSCPHFYTVDGHNVEFLSLDDECFAFRMVTDDYVPYQDEKVVPLPVTLHVVGEHAERCRAKEMDLHWRRSYTVHVDGRVLFKTRPLGRRGDE